MDPHRLGLLDALLKGVTLDHARDGHPRTQAQDPLKVHLIKPLTVSTHLSPLEVEDLLGLLRVCQEVLLWGRSWFLPLGSPTIAVESPTMSTT